MTEVEKDAEIARLRAQVREAFKAGWLVNAIPPNEHEAGANYVVSCEETDWQEWQKEWCPNLRSST